MKGFSSVVYKEFIHLQRDPTTLIVALIIPLIQLIIFGYAVNFDVRHIETVVVNYDNSRESREFLARLEASQYLDIVSYVRTPQEATERLREGSAKVAVIIPSGFARILSAGGNPNIGVLVDGSDAQVSIRARFAIVRPPSEPIPGTPDARVNVLFNPTSRTAVFMVPGLIAVILQVVTVALTAFSIVREKEQGTLEQLMVTPVGRLALMLGKLIPYAALAMTELIVVLTISNVVFGVSIQGNVFWLLLMSMPFVVSTLAIGMLISTFANTQTQALQFSMLFTLPSVLLSGYISPRETMPGWLYILSLFLPATHYMQITRGIIVRGAGFFHLFPHMLILIAMALVLITISTKRFRKSIA